MMRQAVSGAEKNRGRVHRLPAPVGGLNALNSIVDMPATDALVLDNFFPRASDVVSRKGSASYATVAAADSIQTLMGYSTPSGAPELFAACASAVPGATGIYDVTNPGAVTLAKATTSAKYHYVNVTTAGGSFLWACNGVDDPLLYDGTTWLSLTAASVPAITGITTTEIVNVSQFKTRLILCRANSLSFYYLPNNAIAGAAAEFPLGALFRKGGYLMATASWTMDAGNGPDDFFVAITSEGEMAVYQGTDPSASATFALVGIFEFARPLGRKCFFRTPTDTCVLTESAVLPLSKVLQKNLASQALSRKIEQLYASLAETYKTLDGWCAVSFAEGSMLLVNIPYTQNTSRGVVQSYQLVMNLTTGAWTRFSGWDAQSFLVHDGKLYFANNTSSTAARAVCQGWVGTSDRGSSIQCAAQTAYGRFGTGGLKHFKLVCPIITSTALVKLGLAVGVDFTQTFGGIPSLTTADASSGAVWGSALWGISVWPGLGQTTGAWRTVFCKPGRSAAIRLRVNLKDVSMSWSATDLIIEDGGLM